MENSIQPAFAVSREIAEMSEITEYPYGLTKREYFAAKAMQGLLAADARYGCKNNNYNMLAEDAVAHSDALLSALAKQTNATYKK